MHPRVGCGGIEVGFLHGFISVKAAMTLQFVKVECMIAEEGGATSFLQYGVQRCVFEC